MFETERLILRPWNDEDAKDLYEYAKDPTVGPSAGWPVHTSLENSREIIRTVLSEKETYTVCLKERGKAIGSIGLFSPTASHVCEIGTDEMEVGYWIGAPHWGQGLIPEAVRRLMEYAFLSLGCNALWCGYYEGNIKSKRCMEKCGFKLHHIEKDKPCPLMGDTRTEYYTKISREEWDSLKKG